MSFVGKYEAWILAAVLVAGAVLWFWKPWEQPHEASVGEEMAVIQMMDDWYADFPVDRPSNQQIVSDADEACEGFRENGSLEWHMLAIVTQKAYATPEEFENIYDWPLRYEYQADVIGATGYCPEASDAWDLYQNGG
jgi:hypothetical protein